jgi:L-alanine-DL-glutamate epimerase-like enolase superfamily enzyme
VESFDWIDPLIDNSLQVKDGYVSPRDQPGWGFMFLDEYLEEI